MRHRPSDHDALHAGFTLVEVIVVVAILGLVFTVSGLAFTSLRAPREAAWVTSLRRARAKAIESGRPVRAVLPADTGFARFARTVLFLPDGRTVGSGADALTGVPRVAAP